MVNLNANLRLNGKIFPAAPTSHTSLGLFLFPICVDNHAQYAVRCGVHLLLVENIYNSYDNLFGFLPMEF